jgi:NAD(P)-dependent dehydrogenase (short-subunit alcohol dehydrogenase family)
VTSAAELGDTISAITLDLFRGHLDIVVANAGIATHYAAEDYTPEQFQQIMNVNLNGAFYTAQAGGRHLQGAIQQNWQAGPGYFHCECQCFFSQCTAEAECV